MSSNLAASKQLFVFVIKQISKMGRKNKVTKRVTVSANDRAVRDEEADGSTEEFAVAGMGLQEPTAAAAEGSGGETMVLDDAAPPAHGALPAAMDPSSGEGTDGDSESAAAVLTLEQQGAAILAGFKEHARGKKWLAEKILFLSHADRGRAQDDVDLMGETDLRTSGEKGTVN